MVENSEKRINGFNQLDLTRLAGWLSNTPPGIPAAGVL